MVTMILWIHSLWMFGQGSFTNKNDFFLALYNLGLKEPFGHLLRKAFFLCHFYSMLYFIFDQSLIKRYFIVPIQYTCILDAHREINRIYGLVSVFSETIWLYHSSDTSDSILLNHFKTNSLDPEASLEWLYIHKLS